MKIMPFLKEPLPSPARQGEKVVQKTSKHYDSMTLRGSHGALASDAWTSFDRAPFLGSFATTHAAAWSPKAEALPSAWTATALSPTSESVLTKVPCAIESSCGLLPVRVLRCNQTGALLLEALFDKKVFLGSLRCCIQASREVAARPPLHLFCGTTHMQDPRKSQA